MAPASREGAFGHQPSAISEKLTERWGDKDTDAPYEGHKPGLATEEPDDRSRGKLTADPYIRDATEADLPRIVETYNSAVPLRNVTADTEPVTVDSRKAWFRAHDPGRKPLWVAEENGEVAVWLSLGEFYDGRPAYHATAEVGVYVADGYRRRGVGRVLLGEAIRRAPRLDLKTLTAGAFGHNGPSLRLFEGFGFERWALFPRVAEVDGVERDLVVLGLRLGREGGGSV